MACASKRGRRAFVDSGKYRVETAQAAKACRERNLGHGQVGIVDQALGALNPCRLGDLGGRGADMLLEQAQQVSRANAEPLGKRFDARLVERTFVDETHRPLNAGERAFPGDDPSVLSTRAILARAPVHIDDVMSDAQYDRQHVAASGIRRLLLVPMLREGVPLGAIVAGWAQAGATPKQHEDLLKVFAAQVVIAIENVRLFDELNESLEQQTAIPIGVLALTRSEVRPFTDKQIELVATFADQAVIAIENVRLFDEVQARTRELAHSVEGLQALGEVTQAVNSTLDLETVLSTIVAKAVQLSETEGGADAPRPHGRAGPCVASSDAVRAPRRRDARRHAVALAPAQCRHGDARGSEVSPGSLLQNELIQRQIGNRLAQPAVLELKVLQALHLLGLQP